MHNRSLLGSQGESAVIAHLESHGYRIRARNYRTSRGEIDIIAEKHETIAFVEVKTRRSEYFALSTVVTPLKQRKIILTARFWCALNQISDKTLRFDVAVVSTGASLTPLPGTSADTGEKIMYYRNAFTDESHEYL